MDDSSKALCWACGYYSDPEEDVGNEKFSTSNSLVQELRLQGQYVRHWSDGTDDELSTMYFHHPRAWTMFFCASRYLPSRLSIIVFASCRRVVGCLAIEVLY
jgi:hypothetical protein